MIRLPWSIRNPLNWNSPESQELVRLSCRHIFHVRCSFSTQSPAHSAPQRTCINAWFEGSGQSTCPMCKKIYTPPPDTTRFPRLNILNSFIQYLRKHDKSLYANVWLEDHMATCPICHEEFMSLSQPLENGRVRVAVSMVPPTLPTRGWGASTMSF
ncbi:hypothetical protein CPB86DRAFT_789792 [Serendipita vermifera]|nr:hypothetical protein CPB86DRAFT_789792 [Serendipita vermifera]